MIQKCINTHNIFEYKLNKSQYSQKNWINILKIIELIILLHKIGIDLSSYKCMNIKNMNLQFVIENFKTLTLLGKIYNENFIECRMKT